MTTIHNLRGPSFFDQYTNNEFAYKLGVIQGYTGIKIYKQTKLIDHYKEDYANGVLFGLGLDSNNFNRFIKENKKSWDKLIYKHNIMDTIRYILTIKLRRLKEIKTIYNIAR